MATEFTPEMIGTVVTVRNTYDGKATGPVGTTKRVGRLQSFYKDENDRFWFRLVGEEKTRALFADTGVVSAEIEVYTPENKKTTIGGFHS